MAKPVYKGIPFEQYTPQPIELYAAAVGLTDSLLWRYLTGEADIYMIYSTFEVGVMTSETFADKAVEEIAQYDDSAAWLRGSGFTKTPNPSSNGYDLSCVTGAATADLRIIKITAGTVTVLGTEAVDLTKGDSDLVKMSVAGSTLKGFRVSMTTPKVTVTDTTHASGVCGVVVAPNRTEGCGLVMGTLGFLRAPASQSTKPLAYFEVPVIGKGTMEDPFRVQVPEEIGWEWSLNPLAKKKYDVLRARDFTEEEIEVLAPEVLGCRVNRLAMTNSALIKSDPKGKPKEYVAIVRVFPSSPAYVRSIEERIEALKSMRRVKEITREEAIARALQLDDKLHIHDLVPCAKHPPDGKCFNEYCSWRTDVIGLKPELIDPELMKTYTKEPKW